MKTLKPSQYDLAVAFLNEKGRPLERALHAHAFSDGSTGAVLTCVKAFQLKDSGYGRSLEPDAILDVSTVLDTTLAFQVFRRLAVPGDHPQIRAALGYLRATYDPASGVWPIKPVAAPDLIGAPWWKAGGVDALIKGFGGCVLNPRAEVLGYLIEFGESSDQPLIDEVSRSVRETIEGQAEPLDMHNLLCVARLSQTAGLDDAWRETLIDRVRRDVAATVEPDATKWDGYGLKPWWIAEQPDDPRLGDLEPGLVDAMLDHEIGRQEEDGGWPPLWDWGGLHPEHWPTARLAWKSVLTEQMLRVLRNFGRL